MNVTETISEDRIQLSVEGRVDVNTAPQLQASILKALQSKNKLTLDFSASDYISSAGLRALLIGQKTAASKGGSMVIVNMNDSMKNVLRMSGMVNILNVE